MAGPQQAGGALWPSQNTEGLMDSIVQSEFTAIYAAGRYKDCSGTWMTRYYVLRDENFLVGFFEVNENLQRMCLFNTFGTVLATGNGGLTHPRDHLQVTFCLGASDSLSTSVERDAIMYTEGTKSHVILVTFPVFLPSRSNLRSFIFRCLADNSEIGTVF